MNGILTAHQSDVNYEFPDVDDEDGFTENNGDCDDYDFHMLTMANEISYDGIDRDCNGLI